MTTASAQEPASKLPRFDDSEDDQLEERMHFLDVAYSIADYMRHALWRLQHFAERQEWFWTACFK